MRRGDRLVSYVSDLVVEKPGYVVAAFLVLTLVFAAGTTAVSSEAGTEQFTEDLPEFEAIEGINDEFGPSFGTNQGSTQLIQTGENVVSKKAMQRMLETQHALEENADLRVENTVSSASLLAQQIDETATTTERQAEAMKRATEPEVRGAVRALSDEPRFTGLVSDDFNPEDPSASAALGTVTHKIEVGVSGGPEGGGGEMTAIQRQSEFTVATQGGDIRVFGSGIIDDEFDRIIGD